MIVLTGSTGRVGGLVAAELAQQGHPMRLLVREDDQWIERWKAEGRPEWALEAGLTSYQALRAGELDLVSDDYEKVTRKKPKSIARIADVADQMPLGSARDSA